MVTVPPHLLAMIEASIDGGPGDLGEELFLVISRLTPLVNVDLFIQNRSGRTLLTWREDEYFGAGWHIPGGIIRYKETAADRLRKCAREELNAEISFEAAPMMISETIREQQDRGHLISMLYRCRLESPLDEAQRATTDAPVPGAWRWHDVAPPNLLEVQRHYSRLF